MKKKVYQNPSTSCDVMSIFGPPYATPLAGRTSQISRISPWDPHLSCSITSLGTRNHIEICHLMAWLHATILGFGSQSNMLKYLFLASRKAKKGKIWPILPLYQAITVWNGLSWISRALKHIFEKKIVKIDALVDEMC